MRYRNAFAVFLLAAMAYGSGVHALEVTAGNTNQQTIANAMDARLNASNALLQATINSILTCNNKGMVFNSDPAVTSGKDADGCVPVGGSPTSELIWSGMEKDATGLSLLSGKRFSDYTSLTFIGGRYNSAGSTFAGDTVTVPVDVFAANAYIGAQTFSGNDSGYFRVRRVNDTTFNTESYRNAAVYQIWGTK
ncbi:MAG: hypothetical protein H6922_00535 [Pseudomonadaceae bacterium]|nr:hypothetical protein [Pseudomonadaceae bacterium]